MATTKKDEVVEPEVVEPKPRLSRIERLRLELAEANAKEQKRLSKKVDALKTKLENKQAQLAKVQDEIAAIEAELAAAKAEGPIVTDGVGETSIRNRQGTVDTDEPEDDEDDASTEDASGTEDDASTETE